MTTTNIATATHSGALASEQSFNLNERSFAAPASTTPAHTSTQAVTP